MPKPKVSTATSFLNMLNVIESKEEGALFFSQNYPIYLFGYLFPSKVNSCILSGPKLEVQTIPTATLSPHQTSQANQVSL